MIKHKLLVNPKSRESLKTLFDKIKEEPEEVEVFVCNKKFTRSKVQRGYYWKVIISIVSAETGYTKEETNNLLKLHYNPKELVTLRGETVIVGGSIENEKTSRVEEIYEAIRRDFLEMDIIIPLPQKVTNEQYVSINELYKAYEDGND